MILANANILYQFLRLTIGFHPVVRTVEVLSIVDFDTDSSTFFIWPTVG